MSSRIEPLPPEESVRTGEQHGVPEQLSRLNIFRVLLRRPDIAQRISELLLTLLRGQTLPHRQRELLIMRVGWATGSDYEWTQHWSIAQEWFDLTEAELLGVRDWDTAEGFDDLDRAVLAATDETLAAGRISADTWERCRHHLDEEACLELITAIGAWRTISEITRSLEIPLEDGIESWPPTGEAPSTSSHDYSS